MASLSELEGIMDDEIEECQKAFQYFDKDGNGTISHKELGWALRSLGLNPTEQILMEMVYEADEDESGVIEFVEFLHMVKLVKNENDSETIRSAFRCFDKDGNGQITAQEFRHFLTEFGEQMTDEEVDDMFHGVDVDGDGHINYEEFVKMIVMK